MRYALSNDPGEFIVYTSYSNDTCNGCHNVIKDYNAYILSTGMVLCYNCFVSKYPPQLEFSKKEHSTLWSINFSSYEPYGFDKLFKCGWFLREQEVYKPVNSPIGDFTTFLLEYFGKKACPRCTEISFPRACPPCEDNNCSSIVFDNGLNDDDEEAYLNWKING